MKQTKFLYICKVFTQNNNKTVAMDENEKMICKNCLWSHPANLRCWKHLKPRKNTLDEIVCNGFEQYYNPQQAAIYSR